MGIKDWAIITILVLFVPGCAIAPGSATAPPTRADAAPMREVLRELVDSEHRAGRFDGVALVSRGRQELGAFAVGAAERTFGVPHAVDEPMPVASVTKQFVAVCVMRAVRAGRVGLDDPIGRHLPFIDRPWAASVTVRQLLAHRSGLPQPDATTPLFYSRPDLDTDAVALAKLVSDADLAFEPGSRFEYNNADYLLLGAMLARVHDKPLGDVLRDEVFTPSGMTSSGLLSGRRIISRMPPSYDLDDGPDAPARRPPHQELENYGAAGAAYSTAKDILAFDLALMGDALLDRESRRVMLESSPQTGFGALGCWVYPLNVKGAGDLRVVERHGAIGGYNVVNLFLPDSGVCVILMCNITSFAEPQTWTRQGLAYRLLERVMAGD